MSKSNLFQPTRLALMGLALAAIPAAGHAALSLNPIINTGTSVTVSGTRGTTEPGVVELFVNSVSRGSIKAAADGSFSFVGQSIASGDKVFVRASQVWNFNTNGDAEGWFSNDGSLNVNVTGGALRATLNANTGGRLLVNTSNVGGSSNGSSSDGAITTRSRVLEFRLRNTANKTNFSAFFNNVSPGPTDVGAGLQAGQPDYVTYVLPLDSTNGASSGYTNFDQVFWLGLRFVTNAPSGANWAQGDFADIDYIRLSEYAQWEFDNAGDAQAWVTGPGTFSTSATATVANGKYTLTAGANGQASPNMVLVAPGGQYDKTYFNNWTVGFRATTGTQNLLFWQDGSGGIGSAGNLANKLYPGGVPSPTQQELTTNLANNGLSGPTWYSDVTRPLVGDMVFSFQPMEAGNGVTVGQSVEVDYIRFGPSPTLRLGPSPTVTAGASAVAEWALFN